MAQPTNRELLEHIHQLLHHEDHGMAASLAAHRHTHKELRKIMSAIEDLKREVGETVSVIGDAVDEMQVLIDKITSNPGDEAAVAQAAADLDALQTKLKTATDAAKAATTPPTS